MSHVLRFLFDRAPEIDISELESLFSAAVPTSGQGGPGGKRNSRTSMGQKPEKVQLVIIYVYMTSEFPYNYTCKVSLNQFISLKSFALFLV